MDNHDSIQQSIFKKKEAWKIHFFGISKNKLLTAIYKKNNAFFTGVSKQGINSLRVEYLPSKRKRKTWVRFPVDSTISIPNSNCNNEQN